MHDIRSLVTTYAKQRTRELLAQDTYDTLQLMEAIMHELRQDIAHGVQTEIQAGLADETITLTKNLRMQIVK